MGANEAWSWWASIDDWAAWRDVQRADEWPSANREILARGVVDTVRFQKDQLGDASVQALIPVIMALVVHDAASFGLMPYSLDLALWGSVDRDSRAEALAAAGRELHQQMPQARPVAVFLAAAGWRSFDSSQPPSSAADRQRVLICSGMWADGTRGSSMQVVEPHDDGSFVVTLPAIEDVAFDFAPESGDRGGLLAAFYKGFFADRPI